MQQKKFEKKITQSSIVMSLFFLYVSFVPHLRQGRSSVLNQTEVRIFLLSETVDWLLYYLEYRFTNEKFLKGLNVENFKNINWPICITKFLMNKYLLLIVTVSMKHPKNVTHPLPICPINLNLRDNNIFSCLLLFLWNKCLQSHSGSN